MSSEMGWWRDRNRERDLEREIRSHLELEAGEREEAGMSAEDASHAAHRLFGNAVTVKEEVREMWGWMKLEQLGQDFRYAVRLLRKSPGFTLTALLSLALGIGANTAIFTVVNAVLLRPLPFPEPERLVQLWETRPSRGEFRNVVNPYNFLDWRDHTRSFENMSAEVDFNANLTGDARPVSVPRTLVSPNFFSVLGVSPILGRAFLPEEGTPGREHVAVLSFGLWQSRFGGDPHVIGRKIVVDDVPSEIVGVMPRDLVLPKSRPALWTPLPLARNEDARGGRFMAVVARLKRGVSLEQAQQDLQAAAKQTVVERPSFNQTWSAEVVPMLADQTQKVRLPLLVLLAAVGLVLLIACANVANLFLMRASGRAREIAIRAALGSGRRRLLQQLLIESGLLASIACGAGLALAYWGVKALLKLIPDQSQLPRMNTIQVDGWVLAFAAGVALLCTLIFGLVPALQVSQLAPQDVLQAGAVRTSSRSVLRRGLVVAEVALSLILLVGAGLMMRSFHRLVSVNPGFETQHLLTMGIATRSDAYLDKAKRSRYYAKILEEIRAVPGVQSAGSVHFLPLLGGATSGSCFGRFGEPDPTAGNSSGSEFLVVSPGYFETMRTPLLSGRSFDARDGLNAPSVVMVNQAFARRFLPGKNPIGEKLNVCWTAQNPVEIVGVVGDARQTGLETAPNPTIFMNNMQSPMYFAQLAIRTSEDPGRMARAVEAAIHRVNPDQAIGNMQTMDEVVSDSVAQPRLQLVLLVFFGLIAGLLAIVGVYGVAAYSVAQRTREIGIRMALGAKPGDVRGMVLREGALLAGAGIVLGLAGAFAMTRMLRALLYEIQPTDPATLLSVTALVLAVVLLAVLIPARRAASVNPTIALRYE